ncbi:MAG: 5-oxoprolinase subunit PxpB [Chloroflexota bacterium]
MSTRPLNFDFELKPMGDTALLARLRLPTEHYSTLNTTVRQERLLISRRLAQWLQQIAPENEFVAGYDSVLIPYDPSKTSFADQVEWVQSQIAKLQAADDKGLAAEKSRLHRIPVVYGDKYGIDLEEIASLKGLTPQAVIDLHSCATYTVYLVGFSPGFAYLGPLPPAIDVPRRANPRPKVAAGSVALAAGQTGVYPVNMPGGWHLIGYTPLLVFDVESDPPVRFLPGDQVQFFPITPEQLPDYEATRHDLTASLSGSGVD